MTVYPSSTTALSPETPVISSMVSPLPTPTHRSFGTFSILTKALIFSPSPSAPIPNPLATILDTSTWSKWNTFIPGCTFLPNSPNPGPILEKGSRVDWHVFMAGNGLVTGAKKSNGSTGEVTVLEEFVDTEGRKGGRVAWKTTQYPDWLMKSERVLEFVEMKDGKGWEYNSWETFGGPMALVIKLSVGSTVVERLGDYASDIKAYLEKSGGEKVVGEN